MEAGENSYLLYELRYFARLGKENEGEIALQALAFKTTPDFDLVDKTA